MNVTVIRTTGQKEEHCITGDDYWSQLEKLIGADLFDTVNLRDGRVMLVDDRGYESEAVDRGNNVTELVPIKAKKPVNEEATKMYHAICIPGTTHKIVGDVIIARDGDFE